MKLKDLIDVLGDNVPLKVYIAGSNNINTIGPATYLCGTYSNSEILINYYETKVVKLDMIAIDGKCVLEVFIYTHFI